MPMQTPIKKFLQIILLVFLVSNIDPNLTNAQPNEARYIVSFKDEIKKGLFFQFQGQIHQELTLINAVSVTLPKDAISKLQTYDAITSIQLDYVKEAERQTTDWGFRKINAPTAHQSNLTGNGIKVAVIDTGIDKNHRDLRYQKGISFVDGNSNYQDDNGHGTHVAGIIAALNNNIGSVGVAPDVDLYIVKALNNKGDGYDSDVIKGIEWALEQNVDIINISAGGKEYSQAIETAVNKAYEKGVLIVSAAGNDTDNANGTGDTISYPARLETVIAVGATDQQDRRASFSATGSTLELVAPGVDIYSTTIANSFGRMQGTSMAAPYVTGFLALLKEAQPRLTNEEIRQLARTYTIDLGLPGHDTRFGFGRIQFPSLIGIDRSVDPPIVEIDRSVEPPHNVLIELVGNYVNITWEDPNPIDFVKSYKIYRNNEFIFETIHPYFSEQIPTGTFTYEIVVVSVDEKESNRSELKTIVKSNMQMHTIFFDLKPNYWYEKYISFLYIQEIITGLPDGTFQPEKFVSRADAVVMIGRALKLQTENAISSFPDVPQDHYALPFIEEAKRLTFVSGYPDGTFKPNAPITRGEIAQILTNAFQLTEQAPVTFTDVPKEKYYYTPIQKLIYEKITTGYPDNTFKPEAFTTRAEFSALLARTMNIELKLN